MPCSGCRNHVQKEGQYSDLSKSSCLHSAIHMHSFTAAILAPIVLVFLYNTIIVSAWLFYIEGLIDARILKKHYSCCTPRCPADIRIVG